MAFFSVSASWRSWSISFMMADGWARGLLVKQQFYSSCFPSLWTNLKILIFNSVLYWEFFKTLINIQKNPFGTERWREYFDTLNSPIIGPPVTQGQLSDGIQNKLCNFGASCGKTRRWSGDVDVVELEWSFSFGGLVVTFCVSNFDSVSVLLGRPEVGFL